MPRSLLAQRMSQFDSSGIRKVFDLAAKLKDPINFSIGLPDFDVPEIVKHAAIDAINRGANQYTPTQGIAPLRERLRKDLSLQRAHLVVEQIELRRRAREKFSLAEKMYLTRKGLEQATDERLAAYKASRFPPGDYAATFRRTTSEVESEEEKEPHEA